MRGFRSTTYYFFSSANSCFASINIGGSTIGAGGAMVDFGTLMKSGHRKAEIDPEKIFEQLPKSNRINDLYNSQATILRQWFTQCRNKRDIAIELNTGGGKTLVGLLIAVSTMRETNEGVLYLVENNQLVGQVVSQAKELSIPAKPYSGRSSINADFDNGEVILVGSYKALFNGLSSFGIEGSREIQKLGGVIVDDAHASLSALSDSFSLIIPAEGSEGFYQSVLREFEDAFNAIDRRSAYDELTAGIGDAIVEVPFWYWVEKASPVSRMIRQELQKRANLEDPFSKELRFKWPLLKDGLKCCQAIVSRREIVIASLYPRVDLIPSFIKAKRRIYMSATITDYGDMIRAYDARCLNSDSIIAPKTVSGVGRRMILCPPDVVRDSEAFCALMNETIESKKGIVRLCPGKDSDGFIGGYSFRCPIGSEQVAVAVRSLQQKTDVTPVSFANRYNGMDFPGDSCRILIIRNLPRGRNGQDELMTMYLENSDLRIQRLARTIEQGIGRGVRGSSDHCVVLLEGDELIDWMKRVRNRKYFTPALRAQLEIGDAVAEDLSTPEDYCEAIKQELEDDENWKVYHANQLAEIVLGDGDGRFGFSCESARAERKAFACWTRGNYSEAISILDAQAQRCENDLYYRGWLYHLAARIAYDQHDEHMADSFQNKAHSYNSAIPYSPFAPWESIPSWAIARAERAKAYIESKNAQADAIDYYDRLMSSFRADAPHQEFEEGLKRLGLFLGFEADRADRNGVGPDVYWIENDSIGFVIEAKNEKGSDNPLRKSEGGQLRTAKAWLEQRRPGLDVVPISVHPCPKADSSASASDLLIMTPSNCMLLKEKAREFMVHFKMEYWKGSIASLAQFLVDNDLSAQSIVDSYAARFEV